MNRLVEAGPQINIEAKVIAVSNLITEKLESGGRLMLDADAVLFKQDSLSRPVLTDQKFLPVLSQLEMAGIKLGLATARPLHSVNWLRNRGLLLNGPSILANGQAVLEEGELKYLVEEGFIEFLKKATQVMESHERFKSRWIDVKNDCDFSFCRGNPQWQDLARASWWFKWQEGRENQILDEIFMPALGGLAGGYGVNLPVSLKVGLMKMRHGGVLGIVSMVGAINGRRINKSDAAKIITNHHQTIFIADGDGDVEMGQWCQQHDGLAISVGGGLDLSPDLKRFAHLANGRLDSPPELALCLDKVSRDFR